MRKKVLFVLFFWLLFYSYTGQACPCGCGSISMLSLYPNETWKGQTSLSRDLNHGYTDQNGRESKDLAPEGRDALSLAFAARLGHDLSFVLKALGQRNYHKDFASNLGWGDPSVGFRYTLLQHNFINVSIPQLDMTFLYKHPVGTSIDDHPDLSSYGMQIHGNGFIEYGPGVEMTWNLPPAWSLGVGQSMMFKAPREGVKGEEKVWREPGFSYFSAITAGYTFFGKGQILGFWEYERRLATYEDKKRIANSDSVRNGLGVTGHLRLGTQNTLSLSLREAGDVFLNKNTPRIFTITTSITTAF